MEDFNHMNIYYKTKQNYKSPQELRDNVERRFGRIKFDLAANQFNHVVDNWYGPDSKLCTDTFNTPWPKKGLNWLCPEFQDISPYCIKAYAESLSGSRIAMLIPTFTSTQWFDKYVHGKCYIMFLTPKIKFDDTTITCTHMMMCMYGYPAGYECWNWKKILNYKYIQPLII